MLLKCQVKDSLKSSGLLANQTDGDLINGKWKTRDLLYPEGRSKLDWFKVHGWGFKDTEFVVDGRTDQVGLTGSRYVFSGKMMPGFIGWV